MHIRFPQGEVEVQPGQNVHLGRQGPHGQVFRDYPNVSRRHATVGVDHDGRAWIVPFAVSNGTFLNDQELPDSLNRTLASGDRIRFAASAAVGAITLYER
jgi:pSer/pThr/pTyr-binding forkhead associated (FHA) protein